MKTDDKRRGRGEDEGLVVPEESIDAVSEEVEDEDAEADVAEDVLGQQDDRWE